MPMINELFMLSLKGWVSEAIDDIMVLGMNHHGPLHWLT